MTVEQILVLPKSGTIVLESETNFSQAMREAIRAEFAAVAPNLKVIILHRGLKIVKTSTEILDETN